MKYKYNGEWIDVNIKALDSLPIGTIILYAGEENSIPNGWKVCDGTYLMRSNYPEAYAVIGDRYGANAGDDFRLPDLRGKVAVGLDSSQTEFDTLGETGGSKYLQEHKHKYDYTNGVFSGSVNATWNAPSTGGNVIYSNDTRSTTGGVNSLTTGNSGNLQPYMVLNYIIKVANTTPTMASVVDSYSTSTQDAYSCNYVNPAMNNLLYSTNEIDTGKEWIDGKKIYRKVVEKTFSSNMVVGDNSFNHNISNINEIINYDTIFILGWDANTYTNDSYLAKNNIGVRINKTQIIIESGQTWKGTFKFIVEYTKTTD